MTEPALTHRLILLQMRQAQELTKAMVREISKDRTFGFGDGFDAIFAAERFLQEAANLVEESEQEERSDADIWEETCQVVRPQA